MGIPGRSITVGLLLVTGLLGRAVAPPPSLADTDRAAESLRQVTGELTEKLRTFNTDLSQTIDRLDRGYRTEDRRQVQGADVDLTVGPADLMWAAVQKFTAFRLLAARSEKYQPVPAADLDHLRQMIEEARRRVDAGASILRGLLVVSAAELDRNKDAAVKARRDRLLRAREGAEDAARQALLAFPFDQQEQTAQSAWDHSRPIRFQQRMRVTVISDASFRMAVTDSGIEDREGRHIFYREEWAQRGPSVIRFRWRVAVETATGEHILLKRYSPLEIHGDLEDLYNNHRDRDYLWYLEPPEDSVEPTRDELESALAGVARSREAIRAHLARVPAILRLENQVREAISQAELAVHGLEPLAAWSNAKPALTNDPKRSDWEIDSLRNAETEALRTLPPESSQDEDSFPAMERNVIVRIRRAASRNAPDTAVKCLQEIWRMEAGRLGVREVTRTVSLILIDPRTGNQTRVGSATKYYKASPDDALEEVYDQYAADDVGI